MKLYLDIETFYDPKNGYGLRELSVVEYCRDARFSFHGMGVAFDNTSIQWISKNDIEKWVKQTNWRGVDVVGHNIRFDMFALKTKFDINPRSYIDTKAMSKAILGKTIKSHSLPALAEHFGLPPKGVMKIEGKKILTEAEEKELSEYCLHDVWLCREIYNRLSSQFPQGEYRYMDQTIRMFVDPKLQLNVPLLEKTAKEEALRRENIFKEIGIDKKEFASNIKFPELLRTRGYDVPTKESPKKRDEQGNPLRIPALALGDTQFLELLENGNEELKTLCQARVAAKSTLLETRSTKLVSIGRTGFWPFDIEYSGADQTHRFSGGGGAGGNPQNFTRDSALREAVEAPKGYKLIVGDFSNIEMRLVAYLSKDIGLIRAIETGRDVYCDFASAFFGRKITKNDVEDRRYGKTAILGLGYGCGWKKFKKMVRIQTGRTITDEESKKTVELYRQLYPSIPRLWERLDKNIIELLKKENNKSLIDVPVKFGFEHLELPSGLKMRYPNLTQEIGERNRVEWVYRVHNKGQTERRKLYGGKALENICQGLAGELCKLAFGQVAEYVTGLIHDEIHLVVPDNEVEQAVDKLYQVMTTPPEWMPEINLEAEIEVGQSWGGAK